MKRINGITLTIFMFVSLFVIACTKEDDAISVTPSIETPENTGNTIHFKAFISNDESSMRSLTLGDDEKTLHAEWKVGEKVALIINSQKFEASITAVNNGVATIEADIDPSVGSGTATLIYPYSATGDGLRVKSGLLQGQDGTLEYISKFLDVSEGTGQVTVIDNEATLENHITMENQYAIFKFKLEDSEGTPITGIQKFTLTKFYIPSATPTFNRTPVSMTNLSGLDEVYIAISPGYEEASYKVTGGGWRFTAATADEVYESQNVSSVGVKGSFYRPTLRMSVARKSLSAVTDGDVGKPIGIKSTKAEIYNSGQAAYIFGVDPVALIVYTGNNSNLTEGRGHALAMSMLPAGNANWQEINSSEIPPYYDDESYIVDGNEFFPNLGNSSDINDAIQDDQNGLAKSDYLISSDDGKHGIITTLKEWRTNHPLGDISATQWFILSIGQWYLLNSLEWESMYSATSFPSLINQRLKNAAASRSEVYRELGEVWTSSEYNAGRVITVEPVILTLREYVWATSEPKNKLCSVRPFFAF